MAHSEGGFVRWQGITIGQFGYANNLFLTFATASLGFTLTLAKQDAAAWHAWSRWLLPFSSTAFMVSATLGSLCLLNRLTDFRETAQIARHREQVSNPDQVSARMIDAMSNSKAYTKKLGRRSWRLLYSQMVMFGVGIVALMALFASGCSKENAAVGSPHAWLIESWKTGVLTTRHDGHVYTANCDTSMLFNEGGSIAGAGNLASSNSCDLVVDLIGQNVQPFGGTQRDTDGWIVTMWNVGATLALKRFKDGHTPWRQDEFRITSVIPIH